MKEENQTIQTIIKAINKFGRVPETYELLNIIDELEARLDKAEKYIEKYRNGCTSWLEFTTTDKLILLNILRGDRNE